MELKQKMNNFIMSVANLLVDHPEKIEINCLESEMNMIVEVYVCAEDIGKLLGKGGVIAKAMRTLGQATGARHKKSITIFVVGNRAA